MAEQSFRKDVDYGCNRDDFSGKDEIMVTITLHEYRKLIEENAKADDRERKINSERREAINQRDEIKAKYDSLIESLGIKDDDCEVEQ